MVSSSSSYFSTPVESATRAAEAELPSYYIVRPTVDPEIYGG
jgi:hypothetical protein